MPRDSYLLIWRFAIALLLLCTMSATQAVTCQNNLPASNPDSIYTTNNADGTATDTLRGLMWKKTVEASVMTWVQALAAAEASNFASYTDWRLPNLKELRSLVEECRVYPSINDTVFPGTTNSGFWSGSPIANFPNMAWWVGFDGGGVGSASRTNSFYVRLVRDVGASLVDVTSPILSAVSATTTTLTATSNETATGYWIVVARGQTAPTAAQVKARVTYAGVTIVASGSSATGAMGAGVVSSFPIAGLSASTLYDFYLVAEDAAGNVSLVAKAQNAPALLLNPLAIILPSSVTTERPIMRGGRGHRWFQVLDAAGVPLSGAEVRYRYVRDAAIASAATQLATTDVDGLFVVSTPALTTGALASRINFSLQVDQVTHGGRIAAAPWAALPMDYVLGARSLEQSWNVEVKADLTGSLGPQVGGAAKIGGWGATARAGAKVSAGVGVGESVTWTHTVSDYGDFATQQNTYGSYNNTAPLVVAIDAEVGVKVGASADARLGAGAINRGIYVGVGIGGEIAGAFGAGFEYKFPTFFAPGSNDEACPMSALTLSAIKPSAGSALGQFVCASPLSGFFDASATRWKGSATINASTYLSTKQLNKQRSDGNYDSHIAFLGVTGEAGGIYENKANKDGTRTIKKQLFTKTQAGGSITPLPFTRTRASARGGESLLSELTYDRTVADSFEHTKLTKYDTLGKPSAVTLTLSSGRADAAKAGFGDLSMSAEVEVSEKISIHTRSPADAQALEDSRATGEIQFDRLPLVQKFQQVLATSASPPPGYNVPPGYFIEREGVTSPIELSFEVAGAFLVGLDLSVSAKAEGVTAALTERGTVTAYSVAGGGAMWKPLLIESYPIADAEIEGLRISPVTIAGKVGTALTNATRNAVLSVGGNVESAGNQIVNGTSALISTAGSYTNTGWRFVLSKASALVQSQLIASTQLKAASASSKVIGAVHFVNLLDPSNVNVEVFPASFTLKIGDVLTSLAAASVPANQVSRLVLMRFDRVTGQTILVPGTLAADQNSYSATVQRRGAYFLVYDVEPPTLTQLLAGVVQASPRVVTIAGSFDNRDLTGLDAASFSVKVDGVEMATSVGVGSMINSRTGEFRVPVSTGLLATGSPASVVVKMADGAGNVAQTLRCAYAVASDVLLKPTTSTACPALTTGSLNITGNASPDRTIDVILLTRYLLGFLDASLTSGLTITGTRTSAVDIANFIGNALLFDVVARENVGAPHPMIDTLILLRLAQGISDDALLSGIQMPNGAGMTTPSGIRALVNAKFGTAY